MGRATNRQGTFRHSVEEDMFQQVIWFSPLHVNWDKDSILRHQSQILAQLSSAIEFTNYINWLMSSNDTLLYIN